MGDCVLCHKSCMECQRNCMECRKSCVECQVELSRKSYNQYMQTHAAFSQWLQGLHANMSPHFSNYNQHSQNPQSAECCCMNYRKNLKCSCQTACKGAEYLNKKRKEYQSNQYSRHNHRASKYHDTDHDSSSYDDSSSTDKSSSDSSSSCSESSSDENEELENDGNLKPVVEEFEYVQLDRFGEISQGGRRWTRNNYAEELDRKEWYQLLYGDKENSIKALETIVELDFCRNCDLHQPFLWPVMPIRMK